MPFYPNEIKYSDKYITSGYEYIHVILPKIFLSKLSKQIMHENEWKSLGIQLSSQWENYMVYLPEPHVILFRRKL
jgi:cyclin-dependent kinase regulatory subunit CKS1